MQPEFRILGIDWKMKEEDGKSLYVELYDFNDFFFFFFFFFAYRISLFNSIQILVNEMLFFREPETKETGIIRTHW